MNEPEKNPWASEKAEVSSYIKRKEDKKSKSRLSEFFSQFKEEEEEVYERKLRWQKHSHFC